MFYLKILLQRVFVRKTEKVVNGNLPVIVTLILLYAFAGYAQAENSPIVPFQTFGNGWSSGGAYTPDLQYWVYATYDGKVRLCNLMTGEVDLTYPGEWERPKVVVSSTGRYVAIRNSSNESPISLFELKTGSLVRVFTPWFQYSGPLFSPDDSLLYLKTNFRGLRVYEIGFEDDSARYVETHYYPQLSSDGTKILCTPLNDLDTVFCYAPDSGRLWRRVVPRFDHMQSTDSLVLFSVADRGIYILDINTGDSLGHIARDFFLLYEKPFMTVPGRDIVLLCNYPTLLVWDMAADTLVSTIQTQLFNRRPMGFSADGTEVIIDDVSGKGLVSWSLATGDSVGIYTQWSYTSLHTLCKNARLSADGSRVITDVEIEQFNYDNVARYVPRVWDASTGRILRTFWEFPSESAPRLSADGTYMATAPVPDSVLVWDITDGTVKERYSTGITGLLADSNITSYRVAADFVDNDSLLFYMVSYSVAMNAPKFGYPAPDYAKGVWVDRASGAVVKEVEYEDNNDRYDIGSSSDGSLYSIYCNDQFSLYSSEDDTRLIRTGGKFCAISPDFSRVFYPNGDIANLLTQTRTPVMLDSTVETIYNAAFSHDNRMVFYQVGSGIQTIPCLYNGDTTYIIDWPKGVRDWSSVSGNMFSHDGKKMLINFQDNAPCLYDISQVPVGMVNRKPAGPPDGQPPPVLRKHTLTITLSQQALADPFESVVTLYTLSGRVLFSQTVNGFRKKSVMRFAVPPLPSHCLLVCQVRTGALQQAELLLRR